MASYIKFFNDTSHPVISVYEGDFLIADCILKNSSSDTIKINYGSLDLTFRDNREKVFLRLWVSLFDDTEHMLVVKNDKSFLSKSKKP